MIWQYFKGMIFFLEWPLFYFIYICNWNRMYLLSHDHVNTILKTMKCMILDNFHFDFTWPLNIVSVDHGRFCKVVIKINCNDKICYRLIITHFVCYKYGNKCQKLHQVRTYNHSKMNRKDIKTFYSWYL